MDVSNDILTVKGEKKTEREEKEKNYHLVERSYVFPVAAAAGGH